MLFLSVAGLDRSACVLEIGVPKLKIDAAGRIALSPEVLTHLGVLPGSELDVEMTGNAGLTFRRPRKANSIAEAFGSMQTNTGRQHSINEINEALDTSREAASGPGLYLTVWVGESAPVTSGGEGL